MEDGLRKNHRFEGFDYSNKFSYYVTICTLNKKKLLSEIILYPNAEPYYRIIPTETGKAVLDAWNKIPELYDNINLDHYRNVCNYIASNPLVWANDDGEHKRFK